MDDTDPVSMTSEWLQQMDGTHETDEMQDNNCGGDSDLHEETASECSDNDRHSPEPERVPEPVMSTESLPVNQMSHPVVHLMTDLHTHKPHNHMVR